MGTPETITELFLNAVRSWPDATAIKYTPEIDDPVEWSYQDWADRVSAATAFFGTLGVTPGDRVLLMLRNTPEFWVADMAALFCGATPVSVYNSSSPEQVAYLVEHSGAVAAVVADQGFASRFPEPSDHGLSDVVVMDDGGWEALTGGKGVDLNAYAANVTPESLATVIYTSGTTGPPKGVMLTHDNLMWTLRSMSAGMAAAAEPGMRVVSYLPLAHIAERMVSYYQPLMYGHAVTCCADPSQLVPTVGATQPHLLFGVPRVWEKVQSGLLALAASEPAQQESLNTHIERCAPLREKIDWGVPLTDSEQADLDRGEEEAFRFMRELLGLQHLRLAVSGAAPLPPETLRWLRAIGIPLSEIYGMSESSGPMTWSPNKVKIGSVGQAIPGCEVALAEDGEIICRGGNVFTGYLNDPEKTADALDANGWLHSGDIGEVDEDGYFTVVDRKKELIITAGGKNISPANLEAALKSLPLVGNAFAFGDQKPFVTAVVALDPDVAPVWASQHGLAGLSLQELAAHPDVIDELEEGVAAAMARFNHAEAVKKIVVTGDIWEPDSDVLTPTSKLKRRGLKARYADQIEALYR